MGRVGGGRWWGGWLFDARVGGGKVGWGDGGVGQIPSYKM